MLLLESVICWDDSGIEVLVDPKDSLLFSDAEGAIPAWVGIEYMAQAISAFAGIDARQRGEPLCLGFLLGTRKYTAHVATFFLAQKLRVKVREVLRDETNLVLFDCQIYAADILVASAEIKAIQPKNIDTIIAQFKESTTVNS
jgi:predicted hotdog family 3-hydroxylacyl-ACP dehydratase